jgi:phosphate transport system protein
MKITTDLERMGDLAVDICERSLELNEEPPLKPYIVIPRMAEISQGMLIDILDAFVKKDIALAYDVISRDDEVDDLTVQNFKNLLIFMIHDPKTVSRAVKITYIAKYIERIADHATNIAEMVVYMVEGKMIRHTKVTQ